MGQLSPVSSGSGSGNLGSFPGFIGLSTLKYIRVKADNAGAGDTDIYTVPAGFRLAVLNSTALNTTGGAITFYTQVKVGASYFRFRKASPVAGAGSVDNNVSYIAEPGESISINTSAPGLNIIFRAIQYPNTIPIYCPKLLTLAAGSNTLYTVPANFNAIFLDANLVLTGGNSLHFFNNSGAGRTYSANVVNSGGAVATTNQYTPAAVSPTDARSDLNISGTTMASGDFVNVTSDAGTAGQFAWMAVQEAAN